jgi:dephospho-CoA kinase
MDSEQLKRKFGIALTGGIATGKSTVSAFLKKLGFVVIDADLLAREAVAPNSPGLLKIASEFGSKFILEDGTLDRKKLSKLVFSDRSKLKRLEAITHPEIERLLNIELEKVGLYRSPKTWFYDAALIYEAGKHTEFQQVWVSYCTEEIQIARLMKRDGIDEATARKIIASQIPTIQKRDRADHWIDTSGTLAEIRESIIKLTGVASNPPIDS